MVDIIIYPIITYHEMYSIYYCAKVINQETGPQSSGYAKLS